MNGMSERILENACGSVDNRCAMMSYWVLRLLVANVIMYFVTESMPLLKSALTLYPPIVHYRPWTLITYMFLHGDFSHLFFNMIGVFFFGPRLEAQLGGRRFLTLYFLSGLG